MQVTQEARPVSPTRIPPPASVLLRTVGPALLILATPLIAVGTWTVINHYDGSLALALSRPPSELLGALPRPTLASAALFLGWIVWQGLLLALLPGRAHAGPVTPAGRTPRYRANGVLAWAVTHVLLLVTWLAGLWSARSVVGELGSMLVLATVVAFAACIWLYRRGLRAPSTPDAAYTGHRLFDFFQGVELHPRLLGLDLKQWINCRVSMMGWSALVFVLSAYQVETFGTLSTGMMVSSALVMAYLAKFFVWETGYLGSLDITHDRFGYYLCWGVLVWVPAVYTAFTQYLALHPAHLSAPSALALAATGVTALWANYAADAQRQRVRETGGRTQVWGRPARVLLARYTTWDGEERTNVLLVSGFWGWARHFHYVPELALAVCWTLPVGIERALPWLYVGFLTVLLVGRARRDDLRCEAKYGRTWRLYRELVPYRMIPGLY